MLALLAPLNRAAQFLFAKLLQQPLQPIERVLGIGTDRLDYDRRSAIEICCEHFDDARGGKTILAFAQRDLRFELLHRAHKLRRRARVQPEFVENFHFSPHVTGNIEWLPRVSSDDCAKPASMPEIEPPVAAQYVVTFLKPEMLHVYRQITALRAFRPVVFCQKRENEAQLPFDPVIVVPKPRTHQLRRLVQKQLLDQPITIYRSEARRLLAKLREVNTRVLHVYFGHIGVHLLPLLEICDLPLVVSFHGADAQVDLHKPAHRQRTARMFDLATLLLARSQSIAERLIAAGADRAKIRIHRTGIPLGEIAFTSRIAPADGAWRCVQACRLIAKKGLATSLRAFEDFTHAFPHATFAIAGEGPLGDELRATASALGIADRVHFTGFLSQNELHALYAESHFFLHPSELGPDGDQEGVPNSMLEAMASGLPVLATRHGGIPEAVEDGVSGCLVAERDHAALGQAMIELAGDPSRYAAMSGAAAAGVRAKFAVAPQARALEGFYMEAIANTSSR